MSVRCRVTAVTVVEVQGLRPAGAPTGAAEAGPVHGSRRTGRGQHLVAGFGLD